MKKKPVKTDTDLAAWCEALASVAPSSLEVVPPGWKTIFELADEHKTSQTTLRTKLTGLIASGKCERRKFRVDRNGHAHSLYHYRLK
jgi:hypothetical protein